MEEERKKKKRGDDVKIRKRNRRSWESTAEREKMFMEKRIRREKTSTNVMRGNES